MHFPLPSGFRLSGIEIIEGFSRLGNHNLYLAVRLRDGKKVLINELFPDFLRRGAEMNADNDGAEQRELFDTMLQNYKSDTEVITGKRLNLKYRIIDSFDALGTFYQVIQYNGEIQFSTALETSDFNDFGYYFDLSMILSEFSSIAIKLMIYLLPDKHNVLVNKDDFTICYQVNPKVSEEDIIRAVSRFLYYSLTRSEFVPGGFHGRKFESDGQEKVFGILLDILNSGFGKSLLEFTTLMSSSFYPDAKLPSLPGTLPITRKQKLTFTSWITVLVVLLLCLAGYLSYSFAFLFFK